VTGLQSRFDWYEITADHLDDGRVSAGLALALGATVARGKGRNGYSRADVVRRGDDVLATVYGGSARSGEVHVAVTGGACDEVVPVLRRLWPEHRVSRADSALDFAADFDAMRATAIAFAVERGLKWSEITNSEGGATLYVGSRTSEVMLRLYKKSEEQQQKHPDRLAEIPEGIVRAELVARPGKRDVKERVSRMGADDVWGLGQWAHAFAEAVLQLAPVRTVTHFRRPSDWSRALHFLGQQYGPSVARELEVRPAAEIAAELLRAFGLGAVTA
jgi:hypothetical protein